MMLTFMIPFAVMMYMIFMAKKLQKLANILNGFQGASRYRGELVMMDKLEEILFKLDDILEVQ